MLSHVCAAMCWARDRLVLRGNAIHRAQHVPCHYRAAEEARRCGRRVPRAGGEAHSFAVTEFFLT